MTYATGESPMAGDRISNNQGRAGTVREVRLVDGNISGIDVKWQDGVVGLFYDTIDDFSLIGRAKSPHV